MNNNIQEDYCSFEVSKLLKEKGYLVRTHKYKFTDSKDSDGFWFSSLRDGNIPHGFDGKEEERVYIPTHSLAIKWIRENFNIFISITADDNYLFRYQILSWNWYEPEKTYRLGHIVLGESMWDTTSPIRYKSIDTATEAALLYTLQNLIK